ncbi:Metabotropic glutamate receptor 2 [Frankliniella fusca]|uniref:Metabotropic glutamate receptor 2 n=1 Tax=Frankliniella fusca TaxID=407009 RepID=A0AAE1HJW2_9NEOP|nr:Metabotropic glutamate receptor 2 [Frankliniella fusca]
MSCYIRIMAKLLNAAVLCFCLLQVIMAKPSSVFEACFERHGVPTAYWKKLLTSKCSSLVLISEKSLGKCAGLTDHAQQIAAYNCLNHPYQ